MSVPLDLPDLAAKRAELAPAAIALVESPSGRELTYARLAERVGRAAALLRDAWGVREGDRVAVLAENRTATLELLFACGRIGAWLVPLNWRLAVPELVGIIEDAEPTGLIWGPELAEPAAALLDHLDDPRTLLLSDDPGDADVGEGSPDAVDHYERLLEQADPDAIPPRELPADATWYLLYTSGTTGRPKGVIQTPRMTLVNHLNIGTAIDLTSADTTLNVLPQFHTGGLNLHTLPTLIAGGTAIVQRAFEPQETLALLAERTTAFFGVPAIYQALLPEIEAGEVDLAGVRSWASGGAPMPTAVIERYAARGIIIRQGFGMTETGPTVFLIDEQRALEKAGSVGKPQILVEVRVVDRDGHDVPDGEAGELWIRGPGVTPGYHGRPDEQAAAFTQDGWLRSGDVARRDPDGYYTIVDRWKDMFISGGENVFPAEIEQVLHTHPAVAEAAVVGVPDERWGEVGAAAIVTTDGADLDEDELAREIRERCAAELARYKVPAHVVVIDELPRNAAGKVLKDELRALVVGPHDGREETT